jgi:hypothetical protein
VNVHFDKPLSTDLEVVDILYYAFSVSGGIVKDCQENRVAVVLSDIGS